ncbi:hypothetical protein JW921_08755 [Candidatus Fermentibacterales bacterium]|nr:hypothetical protein [Candidatus Fermentibacterales bacterium]
MTPAEEDRKILVTYYSRTGVTRKAAERMAELLRESSGVNVTLEEISDTKKRAGVSGWLSGGRDAGLRRKTTIDRPDTDPSEFDLVVVGSPVWAFTMCPAIRTFLEDCSGSLRNAAFFCTLRGSGASQTLSDMQEVSGVRALATLSLIDRNVRKESRQDYQEPVEGFVGNMLGGMARGGTPGTDGEAGSSVSG